VQASVLSEAKCKKSERQTDDEVKVNACRAKHPVESDCEASDEHALLDCLCK
jgi:hypothetical protein